MQGTNESMDKNKMLIDKNIYLENEGFPVAPYCLFYRSDFKSIKVYGCKFLHQVNKFYFNRSTEFGLSQTLKLTRLDG
jgi:hypothetical protein